MNTQNINNIEYIMVDYIRENAPIYSKGSRSSRDLMKRKKINQEDYIFMKLKADQYIQTDGKSYKDKVFIKKSITDTIPELNNEKGITDDGIEEAPEIIELSDSEKFFDNDGTPLEIETRGSRTVKTTYFKVKDVEKAFNIKKLQDTIIHIHNKYEENIDYKYFICKNPVNNGISTNKLLFLTYQGILRVLFVSRNNKMNNFISWATETLFTIQMGTNEEKKKLFDKILGSDLESSRKVIRLNSNNLSAIYLLTLGFVKDLRQDMNLDESYSDDMIVCKYGRTKDLPRRLEEHKKTFQSISSAKPYLKIYIYIDGLYESETEQKIKQFFKNTNKTVIYKDYKELVVLDKEFLKETEEHYRILGNNYVGTQHEAINAIKDMECIHKLEIKDKEHKYELLQKDYKYDVSLLQKDNEMLKLQLEIANNK